MIITTDKINKCKASFDKSKLYCLCKACHNIKCSYAGHVKDLSKEFALIGKHASVLSYKECNKELFIVEYKD